MIFSGFAYYESELIGQLKTDWSRLALARMAQFCLMWSITTQQVIPCLFPWRRGTDRKKMCARPLETRLSPGTQTHSLHSMAETSQEVSLDLKGRERGSIF